MPASLDGKKKTISLTLESANETISLQADNVRMAQVMPVKEEEPTAEADKEPLPEVPTQEAKKEKNGSILPVVIIAAAVLIIFIIAFLGARTIKARKEKNILRKVQDPFEPTAWGTATEFIEAGQSGQTDKETLMMFQDDQRCTITLMDMDSPAKRFQIYV